VKLILSILFVFFVNFAHLQAQDGRVLALKEHGMIVHSYVSGSYLNVELSNHQWITAIIEKIHADSLQLQLYSLQPVTSVYGTWGEDTLKLGALTIHYNEIISVAYEKGHYTSVFINGTFLKVAGPLYSGLNITNSMLNKEPVFSNRNISQIAGGIIAWFIGKWQAKNNPNYRSIGKRYSLTVI
jgi:hypothetical protein